VTLWGGQGHAGKSVLVNHVLVDLLNQDDNVKVCIATMEVEPEEALEQIYRQTAGLAKPAVGYIRRISEIYHDRIMLFLQKGDNKVDTMMKRFEYAYRRYGFNVFVVDSLVQCGVREDDWDGQRKLVQRFVDFVRKHSVHLHLVAHLSKAYRDANRPFYIADKDDVRGAAAIVDLVHNVCVVTRNNPKEDRVSHYRSNPASYTIEAEGGEKLLKEYEQVMKTPDTYLRIAKMRDIGKRSILPLWFNPESLQFHDTLTGKTRYVQYAGEATTEGSNVVGLDSIRTPYFDDEEVI
jgi:twinkle protein